MSSLSVSVTDQCLILIISLLLLLLDEVVEAMAFF